MDPNFNYIEEANLTMSEGFHSELVSQGAILTLLEEAISALHRLDKAKKALFYGRKPQGSYYLPLDEDIKVDALHPVRQSAINLLHGIIGHATESGEMLEALANALRGEVPLDVVNVQEEIGDSFWYDAAILRVFGATFEDVQRVNIKKLRSRFPNNFSEYDANNRNLEAERKILDDGARVKQRATLENWWILGNAAFGDVVGHPRLGNMAGCQTSKLIFAKPAMDYKEGDELESMNTIYLLGKKYVSEVR